MCDKRKTTQTQTKNTFFPGYLKPSNIRSIKLTQSGFSKKKIKAKITNIATHYSRQQKHISVFEKRNMKKLRFERGNGMKVKELNNTIRHMVIDDETILLEGRGRK